MPFMAGVNVCSFPRSDVGLCERLFLRGDGVNTHEVGEGKGSGIWHESFLSHK